MVTSYNAEIKSYNNRLDSLRSDQAAFNFNCAGKSYYEADMQAIRGQSK